MDGCLLLNLYGASDRSVDAVEYHEQRVATGVDYPAAMFPNCRIDQVAAERPQPLKRSHVIRPNQTAVTDHIRMDDGDQPPPSWGPTGQV